MAGSTAAVRTRAGGLGAALAARAVVCALTAIAVTFQENQLYDDGSPFRGLLVFGLFGVLQGAALAFGARLVPTAAGRRLTWIRAGVSVVLGGAALALLGAGVGTLVLLVTVWLVVSGALELVGGLRTSDRGVGRDSVILGVVALICGLVASVANPDLLLAMGLVTAWAAIAAVLTGIAAASTRHRPDEETAA